MARNYFMTQPFEPGMVNARVGTGGYDVIVGIDLGLHKCAAYLCAESTGRTPASLILDARQSFEIPACVRYGPEGEILIGRDAAGAGCVRRFRVDPALWHETHVVSGRTFREMHRDFLAVLWKQILENNLLYGRELREARERGRLLIVMGCPASGTWLDGAGMDGYAALISEAVGGTRAAILPEPVAALMAPYPTALQLNRSYAADRGVAVYDFGAAAISFAYVRMGKSLLSKSLPLGGAHIDRAMLRRLLRDNGLTPAGLPPAQYDAVLSRLRDGKERFYLSRGEDRPFGTIREECPAGGGSILKTALASVLGRDRREMLYVVDGTFMDRVLRQDRELDVQDPAYRGQTWYECCRKFFAYTKNLIAGQPCAAVVLTGGTSHLPFVRELCRQTYRPEGAEDGAPAILEEPRPSGSVARGLCFAGLVESDAAGSAGALRATLADVFTAEYGRFRGALGEALFELFWETCADAFLAHAAGRAAEGERVDDTFRKLAATPAFSHRVEEAAAELLSARLESCREPIRSAVHGLSGQFGSYDPYLPPGPPRPEPDAAEELVRMLDLSALAGFFTGAFPAMDAYLPMETGQAREFLSRRKQKLRRKYLQKLQSRLAENGGLRPAFNRLAEEQLELALGSALFLVFEDKPDLD